jgi:hypothetical protein
VDVKLHYGKPDAYSFDEVVDQFADNEFRNETRSTVPLLEYWRDMDTRTPCLLRRLELPTSGTYDACFEYPVPCAGRGKASFTDLMIYSQGIAIAIEGKHREPRSATVTRWFSSSKNHDNRNKVLQGWLDMIGDRTRRSLTTSNVKDIPYQLVHRTASACHLSKKRTVVIYQVFTLEGSVHKGFYNDDMRSLRDLVGEAIDLYVLKVTVTPVHQNILRSNGVSHADWVRQMLKRGTPAFYEFPKGGEELLKF